jgi:PAS domain S-box-containing protein
LLKFFFPTSGSTVSLAQRIERLSMIVLMTFVLVLGSLSWLLISHQEKVAYQLLIDKELELQVGRVSTLLRTIHGEFKQMARSSLISTALVDSVGKEAYLVPYLQGFHRVDGVPMALIFVDFEGKEIATNGKDSFTKAHLDWLGQRIANPSLSRVAIMGSGETAELLVAEMVYYSRTKVPEGALMYRLKISSLTGPQTPLHWRGDGFSPSEGASWRPLELPTDLNTLGLTLALNDTGLPRIQLDTRFFIYLVATFLTIAAAAVVSRRLAQHLTGDLQRLSDFAANVVAAGASQQRASSSGTQEVALVAEAINGMLDRLEMQHRRLQQESETKFQNLVENIPGASYRQSLSGSCALEYLSRGIEDLTGYAAGDFLGSDMPRLYADIIYPHDHAVRQALDGQLVHVWEYRIVHANGEVRWISERNRVVYGPDGNPSHLEGVLFNITEAKQAQQALVEAVRTTEAANRAKSQFLATMSHELRTPMNGIVGMAELLTQPTLDADNRIMYAQIVFESSQSLLALLNDILDLSRIEAGKMVINQLPLSPEKIIANVVTFFTAAARNKNLEIEARCDGTHDCTYLGDSLRLRQMLSNLVGNAVKFTDRGGIHLQVKEVARKAQFILLEFSVSDTGIGISPEKQALLFKPFSQVDNSDTRKHGGSGLGLSITHHLAKLMGGTMGVDSEAGKGSRFWFQIQLGLPNAEQGPGKADAQLPPVASPQPCTL